MSQINTNWTQTETLAFIPNKWVSILGSNSGSDPSKNKNIKQFCVKQKIGSEVQKWREK
jgi:hypothetical protein